MGWLVGKARSTLTFRDGNPVYSLVVCDLASTDPRRGPKAGGI